MIENMNDNTKSCEITIPCTCGCKILQISQDQEEFITISIYENMFYSKQHGLVATIKHRIISAWNILRGKEHWLFNIYVEKEDSNQFINNLIVVLEEFRKDTQHNE